MDGNNLQSTEYYLNFAVLGNTTTTTEVVTITEMTNDLPLVLGLGLSLALLSLLSLLILGGCCCLKKLRQPCMKQNIVREQTQSSQLDRTSLTDTNEMHGNSPGSFQPKYSNNI